MCVVVAGEEEGFDKFPNCLNNKLPCWVRLNYNRGKFEGGKLLNWANLILRESSLSSSLSESREITKINAIVPSGKEEKREGEKWKKPFPEEGGGGGGIKKLPRGRKS